MNYWKFMTKKGLIIGAYGYTFAEACNKCGYGWKDCHLVAVY